MYYDTSGYGDDEMREFFAAFPVLSKRLEDRRPHDLFRHAEYRFWFLLDQLDGEPDMAIETTGAAYYNDGITMDLMKEYKSGKSIDAIVGMIRAHYLVLPLWSSDSSCFSLN